MSRIFIVGSGRLGASTGRALAQAGHQVTFIDAAERRLAGLKAEGFDARPELSLVGEPDSFVFLCHPTTSRPKTSQPAAGHPRDTRAQRTPAEAGNADRPAARRPGHDLAEGQNGGLPGDRRPGYDLAALNAGVEQVARALVDAQCRPIVVVRSCVPPGTTQDLVGWQLERICGRREGEAFALAVNPELASPFRAGAGSRPEADNPSPPEAPNPGRPGAADSGRPEADNRHRLTVVGARDPLVIAALRDLLTPLGGGFRAFCEPAAAELVKCTHSALHATRISFWNEIWQICDRLGLNQDEIADAVAGVPEHQPLPESDPRPEAHPQPRPRPQAMRAFGTRGGAPYGGDRLPRDLGGLLDLAGELDLPVPLLKAVVEVNDFFDERMSLELEHLDLLAALPPGAGVRPPLPGDPAEPDDAWHPLAGRHRAHRVPRVPRQYGH